MQSIIIDNNGDAVLLNVLHHLFSSEQIQVIGFIQHQSNH
jgi:hypothetical protein